MKIEELRSIAKIFIDAFRFKDIPLLAHLVITRRCNLSCTYCIEFDKVSDPVSFDVLMRRVEALAKLKTKIITVTGGEPLLHPDVFEIIEHIRSRGFVTTLITNGILLTREKIERLNDSGLQELQMSIDSIEPSETSLKCLKLLEPRLKLLADFAQFKVNINSVLGISLDQTLDALVIVKHAKDYGFSSTLGLLHDEHGIHKPLEGIQLAKYKEIFTRAKSWSQWFNYFLFQRNIIEGKANRWKCRAGARYLYICEHGLVHWCSQQQGYPAIPLEDYTVDDIRREYATKKNCSPLCTVNCAHNMSCLDRWRSKQSLADPSN
jgi:MoaA/NifB/PqqE/SkfB family radical SAM enzyme